MVILWLLVGFLCYSAVELVLLIYSTLSTCTTTLLVTVISLSFMLIPPFVLWVLWNLKLVMLGLRFLSWLRIVMPRGVCRIKEPGLARVLVELSVRKLVRGQSLMSLWPLRSLFSGYSTILKPLPAQLDQASTGQNNTSPITQRVPLHIITTIGMSLYVRL